MVTTTGFCSAMRADVSDVWDGIYAHPFIKELEAGTLPDRKFKFYFTQNYQYIQAVVGAMATAAGNAPDRESRDLCLDLAVISREKAGEQLEWAAELAGDVPTQMAPANHAYTRHVMTLAHGGAVDVLTGLLPCPWTYDEFAHDIHSRLTQPVAIRWLEWWAGEEHNELVERMISVIDRLTDDVSKAKRDELADAFLTSSRYEYMFWDMAYNEQGWPI